MKKRDLIFAIIVIAVVSGLIYLSYTGKHPKPTLQSIAEHQNLKPQTTTRAQCLVCHDPQTGTAVNKRIMVTHPDKWRDEKFNCIGCHKLQPAAPAAPAANAALQFSTAAH